MPTGKPKQACECGGPLETVSPLSHDRICRRCWEIEQRMRRQFCRGAKPLATVNQDHQYSAPFRVLLPG